MTKSIDVDLDEVRSLITYDAETGEFTWESRGSQDRESKRWSTRFAGKRAGRIDSHGYRQIDMRGMTFLAHRLAFAMTYGRWPIGDIDHIDGDKTNNRISNLREATRRENMQNQTRRSNNKSGYSGVYWRTKKKKWLAKICANGKHHHLGTFDCPHKAHQAYLAAKQRIHTFNPVAREA
jgi:hypothetical protein